MKPLTLIALLTLIVGCDEPIPITGPRPPTSETTEKLKKLKASTYLWEVAFKDRTERIEAADWMFTGFNSCTLFQDANGQTIAWYNEVPKSVKLIKEIPQEKSK